MVLADFLNFFVRGASKVILITTRSFSGCSDNLMQNRQPAAVMQSWADAGQILVEKTSDEIVFRVSDSQAWSAVVDYVAKNVAAIAAQEQLSVRLIAPNGDSTVYPYRPSIGGSAAARRRARVCINRAIRDSGSGPHPL